MSARGVRTSAPRHHRWEEGTAAPWEMLPIVLARGGSRTPGRAIRPLPARPGRVQLEGRFRLSASSPLVARPGNPGWFGTGLAPRGAPSVRRRRDPADRLDYPISDVRRRCCVDRLRTQPMRGTRLLQARAGLRTAHRCHPLLFGRPLGHTGRAGPCPTPSPTAPQPGGSRWADAESWNR